MNQYKREVSNKVLDHYYNPRNCGTLDQPTSIGELDSSERGVKVVFYIVIENDILTDIKFQTFGCITLIASASVLTQIVKNKTIPDIAKIKPLDVSVALDGVPDEKMYCCELVIDALISGIQANQKKGELKAICSHPCFSKEAHNKYGRMHLPVSPECNIQCRFCSRGINKTETRPGASRTILTPDEAITAISKAVEQLPQLTVAGIAGPGDALASEHALEVFEAIHARFPNLINCLCTNGLLLADYANRIMNAGVRTVSVTVNAVDPDILKQICSYIIYKGKHISGLEAAEILINAQLNGISKIAALGAVVKINTVLIPGINDQHIQQIAKTASDCGASFLNVMPLIPDFEFKNMKAPDCTELNAARNSASQYLQIFRHCRQCRADACGIPATGVDISESIYSEMKR